MKPAMSRGMALVRDQPDHLDDHHDADDLIHGAKLAAVMKEMAEAKTRQNGAIDSAAISER
jgi:hypothetical protein